MLEPAEVQRLLALPVVKDRTSLSEPTIRRAMLRGEFPRAVKVTRNRIAWRESEVAEWLNSRPVAA